MFYRLFDILRRLRPKYVSKHVDNFELLLCELVIDGFRSICYAFWWFSMISEYFCRILLILETGRDWENCSEKFDRRYGSGRVYGGCRSFANIEWGALTPLPPTPKSYVFYFVVEFYIFKCLRYANWVNTIQNGANFTQFYGCSFTFISFSHFQKMTFGTYKYFCSFGVRPSATTFSKYVKNVC